MKQQVAAMIFLFFCLFCSHLQANAFDEESLKDLIKQKKVQSIEELLPLLPSELLSNFTLVYDSRSPFKGSITTEYPRVILFSRDTRFVLTFTGHPKKPGYDIVESINFDDNTASFQFYAYDFNNPQGKSPHLSRQSCKRCHGQDPRPIFDSYPLWPGFYGSVLDSFPDGVNTSQNEKQKFKKFLSKQAKQGLYKYLKFPPGSAVSPYLEPKDLKLNENKEALTHSTKFKPNERLGIALTALNKKRIFRQMKKSHLYESQKKAILFELLNCGKSQIEQSRLKKVQKLMRLENRDRIKRMAAIGRDNFHELLQMQELKFYTAIAQVDWVAEQLKISREEWSMALEPNSFSFFDGILSGLHNNRYYYVKEDIIFEMLKDLSKSEVRYKQFFEISYNLKYYDLPFIDKMSLKTAKKSCSLLAKDQQAFTK